MTLSVFSLKHESCLYALWINDTSGSPQGKHIKPAVCACHCFTCILPPNSPVAKPPAASGWLLCYSAWRDHYHRSPLSICPVASQQHFTSSPLIQLLLPSPPSPLLSLLTLPAHPLTLLLHSAAASLLAGVTFAIQTREEGQTLIQSLTFSPLSLSGI